MPLLDHFTISHRLYTYHLYLHHNFLHIQITYTIKPKYKWSGIFDIEEAKMINVTLDYIFNTLKEGCMSLDTLSDYQLNNFLRTNHKYISSFESQMDNVRHGSRNAYPKTLEISLVNTQTRNSSMIVLKSLYDEKSHKKNKLNMNIIDSTIDIDYMYDTLIVLKAENKCLKTQLESMQKQLEHIIKDIKGIKETVENNTLVVTV
jgi:hypothetical protein